MEGTNVGAILEEMGGERMPEGVAGHALREGGLGDCLLQAALEGIFQEVVAGVFFGTGVRAEFGGREDELPWPFAWGVGVFAGEGFGHVDLADAGDEVLAVFFAEGGEV